MNGNEIVFVFVLGFSIGAIFSMLVYAMFK